MGFRYAETKAPGAYTVLDAVRDDTSQIYITKHSKDPEHLIYMELGKGDDRASIWFSVAEFDQFLEVATKLSKKLKNET